MSGRYNKRAILMGAGVPPYELYPFIRGTVRRDDNHEFSGINGLTLRLACDAFPGPTNEILITFGPDDTMASCIAAVNAAIAAVVVAGTAVDYDGYLGIRITDASATWLEVRGGTAVAVLGLLVDSEHPFARSTKFDFVFGPPMPRTQNNWPGFAFIGYNEDLTSAALGRAMGHLANNVDQHDISFRRPFGVQSSAAITLAAPSDTITLSSPGGARAYYGPGTAFPYDLFKVLTTDGEEIILSDGTGIYVSRATSGPALIGAPCTNYNDGGDLQGTEPLKWASLADGFMIEEGGIQNRTIIRFTDGLGNDFNMSDVTRMPRRGDILKISGSSVPAGKGADSYNHDGTYIIEEVFGDLCNVVQVGSLVPGERDELNPHSVGLVHQGIITIYSGGAHSSLWFSDNVTLSLNDTLPAGSYVVTFLEDGWAKELTADQYERQGEAAARARQEVSEEVQRQILMVKSGGSALTPAVGAPTGSLVNDAWSTSFDYQAFPLTDTYYGGDPELCLEEIARARSLYGIYQGIGRQLGGGSFIGVDDEPVELGSALSLPQQGAWTSITAWNISAEYADGVASITIGNHGAATHFEPTDVGRWLKVKLTALSYYELLRIFWFVDSSTVIAYSPYGMLPAGGPWVLNQAYISGSTSGTKMNMCSSLFHPDMGWNSGYPSSGVVDTGVWVGAPSSVAQQHPAALPILVTERLDQSVSADDPDWPVIATLRDPLLDSPHLVIQKAVYDPSTYWAVRGFHPGTAAAGTFQGNYGPPVLAYVVSDVSGSLVSTKVDGVYYVDKIVEDGTSFKYYLRGMDGEYLERGGPADRTVKVYFMPIRMAAGAPVMMYGETTASYDGSGHFEHVGLVGVLGFADEWVIQGLGDNSNNFEHAAAGVFGSARGAGAYGVYGFLNTRQPSANALNAEFDPKGATGYAGGFWGNHPAAGALRADFSGDLFYSAGGDYTGHTMGGYGQLITGRSHANKTGGYVNEQPNTAAASFIAHLDTSTLGVVDINSATFYRTRDPVQVLINVDLFHRGYDYLPVGHSFAFDDTDWHYRVRETASFFTLADPATFVANAPLEGVTPSAVSNIKQELPRALPSDIISLYGAAFTPGWPLAGSDPMDYETYEAEDLLRGGLRIRDGMFGLVPNHWAQRVGVNSNLVPIRDKAFSLGEEVPLETITFVTAAFMDLTADPFIVVQHPSRLWTGTDIGRVLSTGSGASLCELLIFMLTESGYVWALHTGAAIPAGSNTWTVSARRWDTVSAEAVRAYWDTDVDGTAKYGMRSTFPALDLGTGLNYGYHALVAATGAATNYGFYADVSGATLNWAFYGADGQLFNSDFVRFGAAVGTTFTPTLPLTIGVGAPGTPGIEIHAPELSLDKLLKFTTLGAAAATVDAEKLGTFEFYGEVADASVLGARVRVSQYGAVGVGVPTRMKFEMSDGSGAGTLHTNQFVLRADGGSSFGTDSQSYGFMHLYGDGSLPTLYIDQSADTMALAWKYAPSEAADTEAARFGAWQSTGVFHTALRISTQGVDAHNSALIHRLSVNGILNLAEDGDEDTTISGGDIWINRSFTLVRPENDGPGAGSDDLVNIYIDNTGAAPNQTPSTGDIAVIMNESQNNNDIVVKETGNITNPSGADITLSVGECLIMINVNGEWFVISAPNP